MAGPRIVRNRHKIEATVANALNQQEGGFRALLGSQGGFEGTVKVLTKQFKFFGGLGAYYFLWVVSEPVPSYEDWAQSRGIAPRAPLRGRR